MPAGKIKKAPQVQVEAAQQMKEDIVFISEKMNEVGCEGLID
jgi:hypothetical protein